MKFLEFQRDSEPVEMLEKLALEFVPDINKALGRELEESEIVALYMSITSTLTLAHRTCQIKCKEVPPSIRVELRIKNLSFVWMRFVPLDREGVPMLKEKENFSLVFPNDREQIEALQKEGYNFFVIWRSLA